MTVQDGKHQLVGMVSLGDYYQSMRQIETDRSQLLLLLSNKRQYYIRVKN